MQDHTTGLSDNGPHLTPPFPTQALLHLLESEFNPSEEDRLRISRLIARELPPLIRTEVLSLLLGVSHKLLYAMTTRTQAYYRVFDIPKKTGGTRTIATPRVFLKAVQKWILKNILYATELPEFVTGFVSGRGVMHNAAYHEGCRYLARIDIKDFFPSIGYSHVQGVYSGLGFPEKVVHLLTRLCLLDGRLPQGAPTSPCLANLVFVPVDATIHELSTQAGVNYSRYADDLTFSSQESIQKTFLAGITDVIKTNSFQVNRAKLFVGGPGRRLMTTGMVVNVRAQPARKLRRRLRARFHQAKLHPDRFTTVANQLLGWAAYANMYDGTKGASYLEIANSVLALRNKGQENSPQ